jgi:hypothetical protein
MEKYFKIEVTETYCRNVFIGAVSKEDALNDATLEVNMRDKDYVMDSCCTGNVEELSKDKFKQQSEEDEKVSGVILTTSNEWVDTFKDMRLEDAFNSLKDEGSYDEAKEYIFFETVGGAVKL